MKNRQALSQSAARTRNDRSTQEYRITELDSEAEYCAELIEKCRNNSEPEKRCWCCMRLRLKARSEIKLRIDDLCTLEVLDPGNR
jgi:hypothetical protein